MQAASTLKVTWTAGHGAAGAARLLRVSAEAAVARCVRRELEGRRRDAGEARVDRSRRPTCIRTRCTDRWARSCAVADVQGGKATVWSPTQSVVSDAQRRRDAARPAGRATSASSSRGARAATASTAPTPSSYDAALLSQAVGKPVRVQLSRKDEMAWENYGFAYVIDQRVGVDADGNIIAWDYEAWFAVARRPSRLQHAGQRRHRHAGRLRAGARSGRAAAADPSGGFNNGSNAAPSYVAGRVGGTARRHRHDRERARADAHGRVAVLHRAAALAVAPAEHVRARVVPRRDRGAREGRSGRVPAAPPARPAAARTSWRRRRRRRTGSARPSPRPGHRARPASPAAAASRASRTRATTATSRWSPRSRSIRRPARSTATRLVVAQDCGPDLESRTACAISSKAARCRA